MEDEIQACKFPRLGNVVNNLSNSSIKSLGSGRRKNVGGIIGSDFQRSWQERQQEEENSSRIVRVSRGSGGKDRHSKVMTSKGLRDRRVRLSVTTAIQFYDLQDRLGYDQPSKAVDWLIKAASDSISELPSLNNAFAQIDVDAKSDEKNIQPDFEFDDERLNKNLCLSKSACSSTSETSKENESSIAQHQHQHQHQHHQNMSHTASFTELLTGGIGSSNNGSIHDNQIPHGGFSGHSPFNSENENQSDMIQLQHFPFMSEQHLMQPSVVNSSSSSSSHHQHQNGSHDNYNLNFTISSSGLVGYNRGTLQSNSLLPHFQRFSTMDHGSSTTTSSSNNLPSFFTGAPVPPPPVAAATPTMDQQLHFSPLFDARLQLFYRDGTGSQHSDQKNNKCNKN
ncbi:transcription factor TCP24 isoform X2 [Lathyrus oleraceus]|uniref:TCP domain-containing protein n=2 Tax=Pisum sativum TaxID=3888 RepID=A0A9D5BPS7_PEA|nr:transcription factor TCP24 isoform X2 [Pisum sativum]XP_050876166.1 transcription factor TCP24 isoform X2 [Pisum sativum]KAI5447549.1 hypothetical protein KIW84_015122 [Pisum sativum]